jgi:cell division protein FtsB
LGDSTALGASLFFDIALWYRGSLISALKRRFVMQQPSGAGSERKQLQDKMWTFAQRGVVLLVAMLAGLLIGYHLWGQAGALKEQVTQLEERVNLREKERDTLKSQMAIVDRDKKEVERQLRDCQARCAAPAEAGTAAHP